MAVSTDPSRSGEESETGSPGRLYDLAVWLVTWVARVFLRVTVTGRENIPPGAFIIVSNHLSWTDTAFVIAALPKRPAVHTMANQGTVFNRRWKRWLMPRLAVFAVSRRRGQLDQAAVDTVYRLLDEGERVLIFPEGAYGRDGQLRPLRDGIGYFAINSRRPILPISLTGTGRLRPFSRVEVVIGEPFIPRVPPAWEAKRRVRAVVDIVSRRLARLQVRRRRSDGAVRSGAADVRGDPGNSP